MRFKLTIEGKTLIFDSNVNGLIVGKKEYLAEKDGVLIYDKTKRIKAKEVMLQMSANTSTLVPALRALSIPYNSYFDKRDVVESQNNITFYWNKSKLAAYYNKFSTDEQDYPKREATIRKAVSFLIKTHKDLPLSDEYLKRILEPCKLIGFYKGFPIFDGSTGFAKLQARLGIHIDPEAVMISTPMHRYEQDVYEVAKDISARLDLDFSKKKNRVVFPKTIKLLNLFGIEKYYGS